MNRSKSDYIFLKKINHDRMIRTLKRLGYMFNYKECSYRVIFYFILFWRFKQKNITLESILL